MSHCSIFNYHMPNHIICSFVCLHSRDTSPIFKTFTYYIQAIETFRSQLCTEVANRCFIYSLSCRLKRLSPYTWRLSRLLDNPSTWWTIRVEVQSIVNCLLFQSYGCQAKDHVSIAKTVTEQWIRTEEKDSKQSPFLPDHFLEHPKSWGGGSILGDTPYIGSRNSSGNS